MYKKDIETCIYTMLMVWIHISEYDCIAIINPYLQKRHERQSPICKEEKKIFFEHYYLLIQHLVVIINNLQNIPLVLRFYLDLRRDPLIELCKIQLAGSNTFGYSFNINFVTLLISRCSEGTLYVRTDVVKLAG